MRWIKPLSQALSPKEASSAFTKKRLACAPRLCSDMRRCHSSDTQPSNCHVAYTQRLLWGLSHLAAYSACPFTSFFTSTSEGFFVGTSELITFWMSLAFSTSTAKSALVAGFFGESAAFSSVELAMRGFFGESAAFSSAAITFWMMSLVCSLSES